MEEKNIRKSKWFWTWQDDREETWLREMARQGLHLVKVEPFSQYLFNAEEPREVVYRLDFVRSDKKDETYFQLFRDAGWEHVGEMMGWQYWRKEVKAGDAPEIFTDMESKVQKYRRLLGFLAIMFLPLLLSVINMRGLLIDRMVWEQWDNWAFAVIQAIVLLMFFLYIFIFIRIGMRIRQLKRL